MLTEKQKLVLAELRRNSRMNLEEIKKRLNMPKSTVARQIKSLRRLTMRNVSLCDFSKLGFGLRVAFIAGCEEGSIKLQEFLKSSSKVNSIQAVNTKNKLFFECFFRDFGEYEHFSEELLRNGALGVKPHYVLEELKSEDFIVR